MSDVYYKSTRDAIFDAIENKDENQLAEIFEEWEKEQVRKPDYYEHWNTGETPLQYASYNSDTDIVELLIKYGSKIDKTSKYEKNSPLILALRAELEDIAELLIEKGADVNFKGDNGETPLFMACRKASKYIYPIAELLIKKGANVNALNNDGKSILWIMTVDEDMLDSYEEESFTDVIPEDYSDMFALLVEKGANINFTYNEQTLLSKAIEAGTIGLFGHELENNGDIKFNIASPTGNLPAHDIILFISDNEDSRYESYSEFLFTIIDKTTKLDSENEEGFTPFGYAIAKLDETEPILYLLEDKKYNPTDRDIELFLKRVEIHNEKELIPFMKKMLIGL